MLDVILVNGVSNRTRDLVTGKIESAPRDAVVLATGGYGNAFYLSTTLSAATWRQPFRGLQKGRGLRQSVLHADSSTCIRHRRSSIEADAHVGSRAQRWPNLGAKNSVGDKRAPSQIPENERDYYLERNTQFGNLAPRDIFFPRRKEACDHGWASVKRAEASISTSRMPLASKA